MHKEETLSEVLDGILDDMQKLIDMAADIVATPEDTRQTKVSADSLGHVQKLSNTIADMTAVMENLTAMDKIAANECPAPFYHEEPL